MNIFWHESVFAYLWYRVTILFFKFIRNLVFQNDRKINLINLLINDVSEEARKTLYCLFHLDIYIYFLHQRCNKLLYAVCRTPSLKFLSLHLIILFTLKYQYEKMNRMQKIKMKKNSILNQWGNLLFHYFKLWNNYFL